MHPGQFLEAGTLLTTLQGVENAANVDLAVSQSVALGLRASDIVEVQTGARVRVAVGVPQEAVVVPVSALRKGPGGDHLFVLDAAPTGETRARVRLVRAGPMLGNEVVILDGLSAGERVAAAGSFKLREGVLVILG